MKASEIREKSHQEILEEFEACKRELLNLRFQWQTGTQLGLPRSRALLLLML